MTMETSATRQATHLGEQFTDLLKALVSDVEAIRSLSSLSSLLEETTNDPDDRRRRLMVERGRHLEEALVSLEEKVQVFQDIIQDEQEALHQMERIADEAAQRQVLLENLLQQLEMEDTENDIATQLPLSTIEASVRKEDTSNSSKRDEAPVGRLRRDSLDPRPAPPLVSQRQATPSPARITPEELQSVPRTVRGRLSLPVLNEALQDILAACRRKEAHLARQRRLPLSAWPPELQHLEQSMHHPQTTWISEQELREACAFFRSGESTARAILLVLRSLNRLRQIPGRHGDVYYILP